MPLINKALNNPVSPLNDPEAITLFRKAAKVDVSNEGSMEKLSCMGKLNASRNWCQGVKLGGLACILDFKYKL